MRKLFTVLIAVGMLMSGLMTAVAQETDTAIATGFDAPATWTDSRGNVVAAVEVSSVEDDWTDYDTYSEPDRGYVYRAIHFTVTNVSDSSMIVVPYDFSLVDAFGRNTSSGYVSVADDATSELFEDDVALAADESVDLMLVVETPADVAPAAFMWQPESGTLVMIDISEGSVENGAVVSGLNTPATWTDDRGNAVATIEVTGITEDWQDYGEYSEPDRGMIYNAVHFTVTNVSGTSLIVKPGDLSLLDNSGLNNGRSWAEAQEGTIELFSEDLPLAAGESYDGIIVFAMYSDLEPVVLVWQAESGVLNLIDLTGDGESAPTEATPDATPMEATPAA